MKIFCCFCNYDGLLGSCRKKYRCWGGTTGFDCDLDNDDVDLDDDADGGDHDDDGDGNSGVLH